MLIKVCNMMEYQICHLRTLFLFVALLISYVPRIAPWRSLRNCGIFAVATSLVFAQLYACLFMCSAMFMIAIALADIGALYIVCLFIWKPLHVPPWTAWQRIVILVFALAEMLPMWFFDAKDTINSSQADDHGYKAMPAEILGLQTSVAGNTDGMIRKTESRRLGGKEYEIGYLEDEVPRKVDGPIFASAIIRCTEKTRQTVGLIADTSIMFQSDEQDVMGIAQAIADEVGGVCGFELKHPIYSSIRSGKSDIVTLFSGHWGNLVAEVLWIRQGKETGFLRLLLHDTGSICEKSPLYAEVSEITEGWLHLRHRP